MNTVNTLNETLFINTKYFPTTCKTRKSLKNQI